MSNAAAFDELLNRAFQLAYFIHADKSTARRVAFDAAAKLEVAAVAQTKRLYYTPGKRAAAKAAETHAARTKVFFSDRHLLQRLVYVESEKYEREREAGAIDEEQMLVHFIKHLVRVTLKRSSFYVALGASRVLHNYSTAETMEIYNVVVQDPDRAKDDYYYRSRKSRLMEELKERFGALLTTTQGARGEERFTTATPVAEPQAQLAQEALRRFTPWNTPCSVPASFDPITDDIAKLSTRAPDDEDAIELNRIHAALHPDCFERLTRALKLAAPLERLAPPQFTLAKGANNMNGRSGERRPPFLSGDELQTLKDELSEQASRRKKSCSNLLSIIVDGRELARLDPTRARTVQLPVSENAELIEVCAIEAGTRTLLAAHLLEAAGDEERRRASKSEIVLEGGQQIHFALAPNADARQGGESLLLTVSYRETEAARAVALLRARVGRFVFESLGGTVQGTRALWKPAFAVLLVIFCVSLFALFKRVNETQQPDALIAARSRSTSQDAGTRDAVHPTVSNPPATTAQPPSSVATPSGLDAHLAQQRAPKMSATVVAGGARGATNTQPPRGERHTSGARVEPEAIAQSAPEPARPQSESGGVEPGSVERLPAAQEATRTLLSQSAVRSMAEVKSVYLEASGDEAFNREVSRSLAERMKAGGRMVVTGNANQADAALKLTVKQVSVAASGSRSADLTGSVATTTASGSVRLTFTARLVNEDGTILWQMSGAANGETREQAIARVAAKTAGQMLKEALKEVRRADKAK